MPKTDAKAKKGSATGAPKKVNLYQQYMKREIKLLKAAKPSLSHKEAFTQVAKNWGTAAENPNAKK